MLLKVFSFLFRYSHVLVFQCFILFTCCETKEIANDKKSKPPIIHSKPVKKVYKTVDLGVDSSEWVKYIGQSGHRKYTVQLRFLNNYSAIEFEAVKEETNWPIRKYRGSMGKYGHSPSIKIGYETSVSTNRYEGDIGELSLLLENRKRRYLTFSKFGSAVLIRSDERAPFEEYLHDLMDQIKSAGHNSLSLNAEVKKKAENRHAKLIKDFSNCLEQIEESNEYDYKNDQGLFDLALFLNLDSVQKILKSKSVAYEEYVPNKVKPMIHKDFDNYFIGQMKITTEQNRQITPVNNLFEDFEFNDKINYGEQYKMGYWSMVGKNDSFKPCGDFVIATLGLGGSESHGVSIWKPIGDSLEMISTLFNDMSEGFSHPEFDTLINVGEDRYVFVGNSFGGDGGDFGGSLWLALWSESSEFEFIYSKGYGGDDSKYTDVTYEFVDSYTLKVSEWLKGLQPTDSLISVVEVDVMSLVKEKASENEI